LGGASFPRIALSLTAQQVFGLMASPLPDRPDSARAVWQGGADHFNFNPNKGIKNNEEKRSAGVRASTSVFAFRGGGNGQRDHE